MALHTLSAVDKIKVLRIIVLISMVTSGLRKKNGTNLQKVGKPDNRSGLELISQLRATVYLHAGNSPSYLNPPHHGYS